MNGSWPRRIRHTDSGRPASTGTNRSATKSRYSTRSPLIVPPNNGWSRLENFMGLLLIGNLELVSGGPLQQRLDRPDGVVDAGVQVAQLGVALRHGGDGELARVDVRDLVPADRRRHGRLGEAAHGIR